MAVKMADDLFNKQTPLINLWQTLADNFYPERSDFRFRNGLGSELADATVDSYPLLARRDLGNSFHAMLRDGQWFDLTVGKDVETDRDGKLWMEYATKRQMKAISTRESNFERSVKEGDMDFATFGNAVLSVEPNRLFNDVVYRSWHLRDCAWDEDEGGNVETVARKWQPTFHQLMRTFGPDALTTEMKTAHEKTPFATTSLYHIVMPAELTQDEEFIGKYKYVSWFIDKKSKHVIEKRGINYKYYVVPRFQTIAGSPYAYSPATIIALPDARTLQAMTYTLLEAAERYARPPMVATQQVITGVVDLRPNGITWVDNEYDERLGAALKSLDQNKGGYPIGATERGRIYEILNKAFYLESLNLPTTGQEMTAYEVQERMKQYRRQNLPLFAPMEKDYNGQLCETTFDLLMMMGQFGSPHDIPRSLQGQDIEFKYKSPLTSDEEEEKMNRFQQTGQMLAQAVELDPATADNIDFDTAFRDAVEGIKVPLKWLRPFEEIVEVRQTRMAQQAATLAAEAGVSGEAA
jgi:hypothetical protein